MVNIKEKKAKLSLTKDAFYTTIVANSFAALASGTILYTRSVAKINPTIQSFHLIGFTMIWFVAMGFFCISLVQIFLCSARRRKRSRFVFERNNSLSSYNRFSFFVCRGNNHSDSIQI